MNKSYEEENGAIQRCPHDTKNPYVMILNDLIRDQSISPNCRWLISYLLSHNDGWVINVKQIIKHLNGHIGRNKVYEIFNEAIEAGYLKREVIKIGNLKQIVKYYVSERPKFKKCFRRPDFRDTEIRNPENRDDKERTSIRKNIGKKEHKKEKIYQKEKKEQSPIAIDIYNIFLKTIKSFKPGFMNYKAESWIAEIEKMISIDKRDPEKIIKIIEWFASALSWHKYILSAKALRNSFDRLEISMDFDKNKQKSEQKKSLFEKLSKHFKSGEKYNGREFFINEYGITFYSGNYPCTLKFSDHGFLIQFENLLRKFEIKIPNWDES
jgi:hypothetical protein